MLFHKPTQFIVWTSTSIVGGSGGARVEEFSLVEAVHTLVTADLLNRIENNLPGHHTERGASISVPFASASAGTAIWRNLRTWFSTSTEPGSRSHCS